MHRVPPVGRNKTGRDCLHHAPSVSDVLQETSRLVSLGYHTLRSALNFSHDILSPANNRSALHFTHGITHEEFVFATLKNNADSRQNTSLSESIIMKE